MKGLTYNRGDKSDSIASYCFICGNDNPRGFKTKVVYSEGELAAETVPSIP